MGVRQKARRPGDGLERIALKIRRAAIARPTRDRQQELQADLIGQLAGSVGGEPTTAALKVLGSSINMA